MKNTLKIEQSLISRLKIKHLSLLVEIDRYQNVLKASKELNMAQPATSRMLQEIEDILGVKLFERLPRGVKTTPYGKIMLEHAKTALGSIRHASEEIISVKEGITGHVRIGTLLAAAPSLLPNAVSLLKTSHPDIVLTLSDGFNENLLALLDEEELDLAITRMDPYIYKKGLVHEVLYEDTMCVVARHNHPKAKSKKIPLSELAEYQWILPVRQTRLRELFDQIFIKEKVRPPSSKVVESVSLHMNLALLLETDMVTFLPYYAVKPYISLGLLEPLDTAITSSYGPIGVTYRNYSDLSPASKFMLECLKKEVAKLS